MNENMLLYLMMGVGALFLVIIVAYLIIKNRNQNSEIAQIRKLQEGTKEKSFSLEILYQKLYIFYLRTPFLKRYLLKLRRRLAIINVEDEYLTRRQASKILTNTLLIVIPLAILIVLITHNAQISEMADKVIHVRNGIIDSIHIVENRKRVVEIDWQ